jgi:hypothetical protein
MIGDRYIFKKVSSYDEVPDPIPDGIVYECGDWHFIALKCHCGCGEELKLPVRENENNPSWYIHWPNTLVPSVQRTAGCNSHFSIKNGIVV